MLFMFLKLTLAFNGSFQAPPISFRVYFEHLLYVFGEQCHLAEGKRCLHLKVSCESRRIKELMKDFYTMLSRREDYLSCLTSDN